MLSSLLLMTALRARFGCPGDSSVPLPEAGFKVEFLKHDIPAEMIVGQTISADIAITNASSKTWPSKPNARGRNAVNLSYHWLDRKRKPVIYDGLRTPLPRDLNPGESVILRAAIEQRFRRPRRPGNICST